jgi:hypothetical protein
MNSRKVEARFRVFAVFGRQLFEVRDEPVDWNLFNIGPHKHGVNTIERVAKDRGHRKGAEDKRYPP